MNFKEGPKTFDAKEFQVREVEYQAWVVDGMAEHVVRELVSIRRVDLAGGRDMHHRGIQRIRGEREQVASGGRR